MRISEALEELNLIDKPLHNWFDEEDIDYLNPVLKTEKEQMKRVQKRNEEAVKKAEKAMGVTDDIKNYGISSITKSKDQKETPVYESLNEDIFEDEEPVGVEVTVKTFNPDDYDDATSEKEAFQQHLVDKYGEDIVESLEDDKAFCPVSGKECKVFDNKPDDEMNYEVWYGQHTVDERYEINKHAPKGKNFGDYTQADWKNLKEAYESSLQEEDNEWDDLDYSGDDNNDIWGKASFADKYDAEDEEDDDLEEACKCKGTLDKSRTKAEIGEGLTEDAEDIQYLKMCKELNAGRQEDEAADAASFR